MVMPSDILITVILAIYIGLWVASGLIALLVWMLRVTTGKPYGQADRSGLSYLLSVCYGLGVTALMIWLYLATGTDKLWIMAIGSFFGVVEIAFRFGMPRLISSTWVPK